MNNLKGIDMREAATNHTGTQASVGRRAALLGVLTAVLTAVLSGKPAAAHEGDYYPDETIPEKALNIIENSTGGGSTVWDLVYRGIWGLVGVGGAVRLVNMARRLRKARTAAVQATPERVSGQDDVATGPDSSGTDTAV